MHQLLMKKEMLRPDYLFEISWEVCNKIGGIYTVLSTKAKTLQKLYKDKTIFWDLKDSGYTTDTSEDGSKTYFYYKIKYRIRLYNENANRTKRMSRNRILVKTIF